MEGWKMKRERFLAFVGSAVFAVLLFPPSAFGLSAPQADEAALSTTKLLDVVSSEADVREAMGLSEDIDFNNLSLGAVIPAYEIAGGCYAESPMSYWPIYDDDTVVALVRAVREGDGEVNYVLTAEGAKEVDLFYRNHSSGAAIVQLDCSFVIEAPEIVESLAYPTQLSFDVSGTENMVRNADATELEFAEQDADDRVRLLADDSDCEMVCLAIEEASSDQRYAVARSAITPSQLTGFPTVYQGQLPLCWAASVSAIGSYLTTLYYSPESISRGVYGYVTGGTDSAAIQALGNYCYLGTQTPIEGRSKSGAMDGAEIGRWIGNGLPVYAHTASADYNAQGGHDHHAVVVCGVSSSGTLTVMNPGTGKYEVMYKNNAGVFGLPYNSSTFHWMVSSVVLTGWQMPYGGNDWAWMRSDGTREKGWLSVGGNCYWFDSNGIMVTNDWVKLDGKWYHLGGSGAMDTGWFKSPSSGYWYYLGSDGAARTGWNSIGGYWYVFDSGGAMYRGWYQDGSTWYYLRTASNVPSGGPEGSMLAGGTWTINGKAYRFDSSGACLNP